MDELKFDSVARFVARNANRRSLLRGMTGGALAVFGLRQTGAAAQSRERVTICHLTPGGDYRQISVIPEAVRTMRNILATSSIPISPVMRTAAAAASSARTGKAAVVGNRQVFAATSRALRNARRT